MANVVYCNDSNLCENNYYYALVTEFVPNSPPTLLAHHTGITTSSSSGFYFAANAPVANYNPQAPTVGVRMANGCPKRSLACATLSLATSLPPAALLGHVMPYFSHNLIGLGPFANQDYTLFLHRPQSQSTTQMVIPSSLVGGMRLACISGTFVSPLRPQILRMQPLPQLLSLPSQLLLCFLRHHPVSRDCPHRS